MEISKSIKAFELAKGNIAGGVNSPARAFNSVKGDPRFIKKAYGSRLIDIDGNEYIDYVGSWGPMILGHAHPDVVNMLAETAKNGTSFGAPTELETEMAILIKQMVPSVEQVRMVNSGTEATMSALRLARGYTQRDLVLKFEGCYHGHGDSFLIKAGSGALTQGSPDSPGVTSGTAKDTLMAQYNDLDSVREVFKNKGEEIAAVILEPVTGNMGVMSPKEGFLEGLRKLCDEYGAVLIFDEVMTGFRLAKGGAQEIFGVNPDLTTFGKIIGGGLPVGAYGGKKDIMDMLSPTGPIYQAGTLSGNPLAMAAGITVLKELNENVGFYAGLEEKSKVLVEGIKSNIKDLGIQALVNRVGSMFTLFFADSDAINSYQDVVKCDIKMFAAYFNQSLNEGIYYAPSQFEAVFVSGAHTKEDIDRTLEANYKVLNNIKSHNNAK